MGPGPASVRKIGIGGSEESVVIWNSERKQQSSSMGLVVLEAMLPLGIIAGMLCVMGNAQYFIHKAAHGRPKHIGNDVWDVAMEKRDKKIMEILSSPSPSD